MTSDVAPTAAVTVLLLVLPAAALISRRVPLMRVLGLLAIWGVIFAGGLLIVGQRARFDPYLARIAAALHLDDQTVAGKEVRITMASDGHFWAHATINGVRLRMLIDSGATVTALSSDSAERAGLDVRRPAFPMMLRTANGTISAKTATIDDLRLATSPHVTCRPSYRLRSVTPMCSA